MNRSIVIGARGWVLFGLVVLRAGCGATSPRLQVWGFHSDFALSPETPFRAYVEQTQSTVGGTSVGRGVLYVKLGLDNGKLQSLAVAHKRVDALMATLRALLPHATFGHDAARAKQFKQNPGQLRAA